MRLCPPSTASTPAAGPPGEAHPAAAPAAPSYGVAPGSYRAAATLAAAPAPTLPPAEGGDYDGDYSYGDYYYSDDEAGAAGAAGASLSPNIAPKYPSFGAAATAMAKQA